MRDVEYRGAYQVNEREITPQPPYIKGENMKKTKNVKVVVFVPETHTNIVREAMGSAGAGKIGNYSFCSFSTKGIGRFKPETGANPHIGKIGKFEKVVEERIEMICPRGKIKAVIAEMKRVHPYEEIAFDIYSLEDF